MFGHDKSDRTDPQVMTPTEPVQQDDQAQADASVADNEELTLPTPADPPAQDTPAPDAVASDDAQALQDAAASLSAETSEAATEPTPAPEAAETPEVEETPAPETPAEPEAPAVDAPAPEASSDLPADLAELKEETLKELSPLVGHLDQPPEEKLKTITMLYESTKDQSLLKAAHDAAIALTDDTARAKALLDLIQKIDEAGK